MSYPSGNSNPLYYAKHLFLDGKEITELKIPESVSNICNYAFIGCCGITSVDIPNNVITIGQNAFTDCNNLATINNGQFVKEIKSSAFSGTAWYDNQPDGVVYFRTIAYKYKGEMPNNSNIILKDGTTIISNSAFSDCSGLTSITLPNSVTNIGYYAFDGCENLVDFYCLSEIIPLAESKCFGNTISINATLYVPASSINAYKSTEPWSYFETIKALPAHEIVMNNNISTYCYPYDLDFTNVEGLKAFVASSYDDVNEKVQMTRINKVPAGTGIILTGNVGSYNVAYATSKVATDFTNLLKGVTTATIIGPSSDGFLNYILSKGTNGIGFYPAKEGTLAAGKAYLQLPSSVSSAKGISMSFDDETTGIMDNYDVGTMNSDVAVYDLQGRKVKNPTKGLYIVNGKKIMIK